MGDSESRAAQTPDFHLQRLLQNLPSAAIFRRFSSEIKASVFSDVTREYSHEYERFPTSEVATHMEREMNLISRRGKT